MRNMQINNNFVIKIAHLHRSTAINREYYDYPVSYSLNLKTITNKYEILSLGLVDNEAKIGFLYKQDVVSEISAGDKVYIDVEVPTSEEWDGYAETADYTIYKCFDYLNELRLVVTKVNENA